MWSLVLNIFFSFFAPFLPNVKGGQTTEMTETLFFVPFSPPPPLSLSLLLINYTLAFTSERRYTFFVFPVFLSRYRLLVGVISFLIMRILLGSVITMIVYLRCVAASCFVVVVSLIRVSEHFFSLL